VLHPRATALGVTAVLAVAYAGLCKGLLFHDLEYVGSDLFSFLDMSWSWYYAGLWLHDNIYGHHYALHNFNLVPVFSALTIPFGAYGFVLGLALLNALAAWRVASVGVLDLPGRLAVLDPAGNLMTVKPDGSDEIVIAEAELGRSEIRQPTWSPDGDVDQAVAASPSSPSRGRAEALPNGVSSPQARSLLS